MTAPFYLFLLLAAFVYSVAPWLAETGPIRVWPILLWLGIGLFALLLNTRKEDDRW